MIVLGRLVFIENEEIESEVEDQLEGSDGGDSGRLFSDEGEGYEDLEERHEYRYQSNVFELVPAVLGGGSVLGADQRHDKEHHGGEEDVEETPGEGQIHRVALRPYLPNGEHGTCSDYGAYDG